MLAAAVVAVSAVVSRLWDAPRPLWPGYGVNISFTTPQKGEMELLGKAGFQYVRSMITWEGTERQPGQYDFSRFDALLAELKAKKIRPIFCLTGGNAAYQVGAPTMPESRAAFARWTGEVANHFKGQEIIWELWDEPNTESGWKPSPSPTDFSVLAVEAAKAMRIMDSGCRIVAPGVAGVDGTFLRSSLSSELLGLIDGVSIHPNRPGGPESILADLDQVRTIIRNTAPEGRKQLPVICTGWGYSTARGQASEGRQAMYLSRMWLLNAAGGCPISIWDSWQDNGPDPERTMDRMGLVRENFDLKPSFISAKETIEKFRGCTSFRRLPQKDPLDWVIVGAGNNRLVQARWYQKDAGITYSTPSMRDKNNKKLYASLTSGAEIATLVNPIANPPKVTSTQVTSSMAGISVAFAPPIDEDGWCALIEKPSGSVAKLEFKYQRNNGANVTCYASFDRPRSVEPLAISESETTLSVGMNGRIGLSRKVKTISFEVNDWKLGREGRSEASIAPSQRGMLLSYDGSGTFTLEPKGRASIPEGANALVVWVRTDGTTNRLRSTFREASGANSTVELGTMDGAADRNGWRVVRIPLEGKAASWVSLLSVEADRERGGSIEIGPGAYEF